MLNILSSLGFRVGLMFVQIFDKHQLITKNLKSLNIYFRYFIYTITIVVFYLLLQISEAFFLNTINSYNLQPIVYSTVIAIGLIFKIIALSFIVGIVFLEFIYNQNIDQYLKAVEKKENYIKKNQLQWWRFKNQKWYLRVAIYLGIFAFFFNLFLGSFLSFLATQTTSIEQLNLNWIEFDSFIKQFIILFIISVSLFEFFRVRPARKVQLKIPKFDFDKDIDNNADTNILSSNDDLKEKKLGE
ncbi:hypothetical protein [Aliarcobacter butzleri]|uniref:hypothetical protein n=1 Tax=Aliarcobacter butzleri TaxID=28197 RepID=UPI001ED9CEB5|nr:hypothetical protein [Aliarcobacter butzleri]MCG3658330.1 hypothetical protein [Aliarcobacter butzleri]MDN5082987.1 hypothetical protein [Aliarcobacter butzleri]MDN5085067.1 hypothetical protein [Aliarcobacter butzleri]